jgi:hypothetical protein
MQRNLCLFVTGTLATTIGETIADVGLGYRVLVIAENEFVRRRTLRDLNKAGFHCVAMTAASFSEWEAAGEDPAAFDAVLVEPEGNVVDATLENLWSRPTATT